MFNKFIEVKESISVSKTFEHIYEPLTSDLENAKIKIFCPHNTAVYTDDIGCYPVAVIDIHVDLPKHTEGPRKIRVILGLSLLFLILV